MQSRPYSLSVLALVCVAALVCIAVASGCSAPAPDTSGQTIASSTEPDAADLSTPASAVRSYLDWISYAYRIGVSDVASHTMTPEESVRVDSYVQYNLQERSRRIDQRLIRFDARPASVEGTRAVLGAREEWEYRYLSADGQTVLTDNYGASYDTTYTVVRTPDGVWVVDSVEAAPRGEVQ